MQLPERCPEALILAEVSPDRSGSAVSLPPYAARPHPAALAPSYLPVCFHLHACSDPG